MKECDVCGSKNFENHAGFFYCSECQTQTQEYQEQEQEYNIGNTSLSMKSNKKSSSVKSKRSIKIEGTWLSWEAFNHILYGFTQDLKKVNPPAKFETVVLQLWACYLQRSEVAFTSRHSRTMPKLAHAFKTRDAHLLYSFQLKSPKQKRSRRSSYTSSKGSTSASSFDSTISSRLSLARKKRKVAISEYSQLSTSMGSETSLSLANETLESLGRSSASETSFDTQKSVETKKLHLPRKPFTAKAYEHFKNMGKMMKRQWDNSRGVSNVSKKLLLSMLHLALQLLGSEIQLSDLLRFIREGHLSYAKVTHFLPSDIKFSKQDWPYIDTITNGAMPTHLRVRRDSGLLAKFLQIPSIPAPDLSALIVRYTQDLQLPKCVSVYSKRILASRPSKEMLISHTSRSIPNYEARAMALIIFTLKMLFGLDGKTEVVLSNYARKINSLDYLKEQNKRLFVFQNWQRYIECRKLILNDFHFPTQEQLDLRPLFNSKGFIDTIIKESKDEHRDERFIPCFKHQLGPEFVNKVKRVVTELTQPESFTFPEFKPSLTPQTTNLATIIEAHRNNTESNLLEALPLNILNENFENDDVKFAMEPERFLNLLDENELIELDPVRNVRLVKLDDEDGALDNLSEIILEQNRFDCNFITEKKVKMSQARKQIETKIRPIKRELGSYWIVNYRSVKNACLINFKSEILNKTPENFQWLLIECARMTEMNVRDLYNELLWLENLFASEVQEGVNIKSLPGRFRFW